MVRLLDLERRFSVVPVSTKPARQVKTKPATAATTLVAALAVRRGQGIRPKANCWPMKRPRMIGPNPENEPAAPRGPWEEADESEPYPTAHTAYRLLAAEPGCGDLLCRARSGR